MAITLRRNQLANAIIDVAKLDLSSGTFDFSSATIRAASPTGNSDVATRGYVDSVAQGLDLKDSCKAATTASITLSGTQSIDSVSILAGDRVLVKNQGSNANGIYVAAAGAWSRSTDMASGDQAGAFTFIEQGSVNGDVGFVVTNNKGSAAVGSDTLVFSQFSKSADIVAGNAMEKAGNQLNVKVDDTGIEIAGDALQLKNLGIVNAKIADSTISAGKLAGAIGNGLLSNSTVSFGGVSLALGASDATPAFDLADATNYPTSALQGTISNAQLAGSIANGKLANSTVAFGGVSLALGASDATPAFDLADATNYPTSALQGTISNAQLGGSITSDKLQGGIGADKLAIQSNVEVFAPNGSTADFLLSQTLPTSFEVCLVFRNGVSIKQVASSPADVDQYLVNRTGGAGGKTQIELGGNPSNGEEIKVFYVFSA
jgi:hypothetical protein